MMAPHPRVLCIWLPNWPIQRAVAAEPKLVERPLVLSARDPRRGLVVAAVNLAGRRGGVRPAMRLSEAAALVELEIREHDPQEDIEALCSLTELSQRFSPIVGLEQLDKKPWAGRTLHQPECLLLDVSGIAPLFGGEAELLDQVAQWLSSQNYFGCLGLAGTIGAAWALANYATRGIKPVHGRESSDPMQQPGTSRTPPDNSPSRESADADSSRENSAEVARDHLPACRHIRSEPGRDQQAIAGLPLAGLRLETVTLQALHRLGLRTIADLEQLPRAGMATRLGEPLMNRWDQALGRKAEPLIALHAGTDWQVEQTLEYPTRHRETMSELVRRLSYDLAARLSRRGEGALRVLCRLDLVQAPPLVMQLGLFRPTSDGEHLQWLLTGQLEQQFRDPALGHMPPLWRLSLHATLTAPLVWRQIDLFDSGDVAQRDQIAGLVDTLSSRLGRKAVLSAHVRRDAQPELAFHLLPMTGRRQDGRPQETVRKLSSRLAKGQAEPSREDPQRRPTRLFSPPVEIQVTAHASPTGSPSLAAAPRRFYFQNQWLEVTRSAGPERLESGWWRGPSARRDYYRVVTSDGGWWWLYRDLNHGKWYLHGAFD